MEQMHPGFHGRRPWGELVQGWGDPKTSQHGDMNDPRLLCSQPWRTAASKPERVRMEEKLHPDVRWKVSSLSPTKSNLIWAFFGGSFAFIILSKWLQRPQEYKDADAKKMYLKLPQTGEFDIEIKSNRLDSYPSGSDWAYVVSVIQDDPETNELAVGVCTLLKNIERKRPSGKHFVAMIPPDEGLVPQRSIEIMQSCRVETLEMPFPVSMADLVDPEYRLALNDRAQAGIGLKEFHKLNVWRLTQFRSVAFMDIDLYMVRLMDKFFSSAFEFVYTDGPYANMNGGFFVAKPDLSVFEDMIAKIKQEGAYRQDTGWYGSRALGRANATPQGFLYWYWGVLHADRSHKLNRCLWNRQLMKGSGNRICSQKHELSETFIYHFVECPGPRKFSGSASLPRKPFLANWTELDALIRMMQNNEIKPPLQEECIHALREYVWSRESPIVQRKDGPPYFQGMNPPNFPAPP